MSRGLASSTDTRVGSSCTANVRVLALTGILTGHATSACSTRRSSRSRLTLGCAIELSLGLLQALGNRISGLSGAINSALRWRLAGHSRREKGGHRAGASSRSPPMTAFLAAAVTHAWPLLILGFLLFLGLSLLSKPGVSGDPGGIGEDGTKKGADSLSGSSSSTPYPGAVMAFVAGV